MEDAGNMEHAEDAEHAGNAEHAESQACERARCTRCTRCTRQAPLARDRPTRRGGADSGYGPSAHPGARLPSSSPRDARGAGTSPGASAAAGLTSALRTLRSPSRRSGVFWRPWLDVQGREEKQARPLATEEVRTLLSSGC